VPKGKAKAATNGKARQKGPLSVREVRAEIAGLRGLLGDLRDARELAGAGVGGM
jgi:hypothetical protein